MMPVWIPEEFRSEGIRQHGDAVRIQGHDSQAYRTGDRSKTRRLFVTRRSPLTCNPIADAPAANRRMNVGPRIYAP